MWIFSLVLLIVVSFALLYVMSLYCMNGPYVKDTYAHNSIMSSFWGMRQLHEDVQRAALAILAIEDKKTGFSRRESVKEAKEDLVISPSVILNTQNMLNSNIPLNQNLVEAIDLDNDKDQYEGGEV